jgi:hypothetical protein
MATSTLSALSRLDAMTVPSAYKPIESFKTAVASSDEDDDYSSSDNEGSNPPKKGVTRITTKGKIIRNVVKKRTATVSDVSD